MGDAALAKQGISGGPEHARAGGELCCSEPVIKRPHAPDQTVGHAADRSLRSVG